MALEATHMTEAIEAAFKNEWQVVKGTPLPAAGSEDRRLLFAAIARGILEYLKDHEEDILKSITVKDPSDTAITYTVEKMDLNFSKAT
ncbi:MAG TPA: hypothetical protein VNM22_09545 [Candidatus Limnocylindrales bacterium]|nr:hypothetical protein [Candidatus Limnocylindrales bacterium]